MYGERNFIKRYNIMYLLLLLLLLCVYVTFEFCILKLEYEANITAIN